MKILVVDCETGGLDPQLHPLLEIAGVAWDTDTGDIFEAFSMYVLEPALPHSQGRTTGEKVGELREMCDPRALAVNKINLLDVVKHGLHPMGVCRTIEMAIEAHELGERVVIAAQNAAFDAGFLRRLYGMADGYKYPFSHRMLDSSSVLRWHMIRGDMPDAEPRTELLFDVTACCPTPGTRHRSLGDAMSTALALQELAIMLPEQMDKTPGDEYPNK